MSDNRARIRISTRDIVYVAIFTSLIAVCSWISIPLTVPVTLQTFAIFVTVGLLGIKRGTAAVLVYILLGAVGLPVFSGFSGGIGRLAGNTGGYIIGFIFTALTAGYIIKLFGKKTYVLVIAMTAGLLLCYAFGTAWFMHVYARNTGAIGLSTVLSWCVLPFIIPDAVKIALATIIINRVSKYVKM